MTSPSSGEKQPLSITAFSVDDKGNVEPLTGGEDNFKVMLNPSEFTHDHSISYNASSADDDSNDSSTSKNQAIGKAAPTAEFKGYQADSMKFSLVIDGTGVVTPPRSATGGSTDVAAQIDNLNQVVYDFNSDEHRPRIVQIAWGSYLFVGRLKSMSVQYTLFKPSGEPLRAKISLAFVEYVSREQESLEAGRESPDLTKVVEVRAGDTLPLLCYRIYKNSTYYAEVARINNIVSFRGLKPGSQLVFPPLR
ncbi:MAG: peptidoglycan-binding protein [Dehalococcoidia bacterium]